MSQQSDALTHVDPAWLSNPKWASGQIIDQTHSGLGAMWLFAAIWNSLVWPLAIVVLVRNDLSKQPIALAVLLFPLVGLLVVLGSLRQTLRKKRFGVSVLTLDTMPASPGSVVAGTITVPASLSGADVQVRLYCTHRRITGSGEHQRTSENTLWEDEREIRSTHSSGGVGTSIRFQFSLTANVPESDIADSYDQRLWRITAQSNSPAMKYGSRFEIPVFRTDASTNKVDAAVETPIVPFTEPIVTKPTEPGVTATKRIDGGWDIHFAAGRGKTAAKIVALLFVVFAGVAVGVGYFAGSYLFGSLFGLFDFFCLVGLWQLLFAQTSITVSRGTIKVRKWSPIRSSTKQWSADQVNNVTFKITAQVGDKPYYSIRIHPSAGAARTAGSGISSKRDARWIAERLREALRLTVTSDPEEISDR